MRKSSPVARPGLNPTARVAGLWVLILVVVAIAAMVHLARIEGPPPAEWPAGLRGGIVVWLAGGVLAFAAILLVRTVSARAGAVEERRHLLARGLEAASVPMVIVGPDGRAMHYNPAFRDLAQPGAQQPLTALGQAAGTSLAPLEIKRLLAAVERGIAVDTALDFADGREFRLSARPLDGAAGYSVWQVEKVERPAAPAQPAPPITPPPEQGDMDRLRHDLARIEERFRRFFDYAPIGIALVDSDLRLAECNDTVLALSGLSRDDAQGRPVINLFKRDQRSTIQQRLIAIRDGADGCPAHEAQLRGAHGPIVHLYARRDDGAPAAGVVLHLVDMTNQKNLEAQFVQSQKMQAIGQLAGGVAHDFNNLLTAMIGFCDLLLLRHKPGDHSFTDIMQIKQNANRAANLVRQLLAFSRQQTLQPRVLSVTDVLAELSNLLRRLIGENIELKMLHGRDLGLVKVDQGQLEQVIINLCVNARDAMAETGGRLTIVTSNLHVTDPMQRATETMPPGDYVLVEVIDTGVGIPTENLQRIFEPFFSTKELGSGTGLGLSTVYGIVRQTGGFVFVDSAPGDGAKFSIYLPRYQENGAQATQLDKGEKSGADLTGTGRILLVEDEDAVRVFSARALRNKGYEVVEAKSGEHALELLRGPDRPDVDLIITDVVMPQLDGPAMIRTVREFMPDVKVIFISGYAEERFRSAVGGGDAVEFLAKPFSLKQLATKVKEVMGEE
ncbi:response regulator [Niveispirillum sp.]|uniref:PAS domain-containing hybrid sensor histidine kinase/response regulator n=1 Tax=Niveispirillum sp. TaxID=1917217 RepID=UPI001B47C534|nr:response regulator [Niveispirillum sp.]MBP7336424.1 response regulator [Niveispirillum sp.]